MKISIPLIATVFTLAAFFPPILNSDEQAGPSLARYDRLSDHLYNSISLQTNMVSLDSLPACQQNTFHSSGNSKQELFQQDLCDCVTQWYESEYDSSAQGQEFIKACQTLQEESGEENIACIESRIEVYEPFTYESYRDTCVGSYRYVFVLSDGTTTEVYDIHTGHDLDDAEFMCQELYGTQIIDTPIPEFPNPPNPGPYIDPNPEPYPYPDPDPVPGPIAIDQETLRILQSILSTPALPITGAIAGGLVAWVLSMLGGGRTVLPTTPRPPTGGLPPGQVGPDGKILSPTGQGWVSKSMYDYQQKWLQKGWRWNSQTGKFEGQHGAVNEKGLVQDDELGWVDQKTFNDNEQMRAQGYVYDRSMGWQTPEDSNRFKSDWDGMRQRERERSADKNAQIQSELKESQAQRDQAFQQQMQKLDAGRIAEIKANIEMYQKRAQKYVNWDKNLEYATYVAQTVETAADVGVAVCARLTGPAGKAIAAAYETAKEVATTADDVIASDDVVGKAEELGDDKIKDEYKDKIKEKIEEKVTPYIPKFVNRIANQIKRPIKKFILRKTGKTGLIIYQEAEKKLLEYGKEQVEEFVEGQVETAVEEIKNNIDPNLLTGV